MANKFKDILFCSDLDDTLLTTGDKKLSKENYDAIQYFMSEGGYFTFSTGRVPTGAKTILEKITPNVPMICFNGGAVYDFEKNEILWGKQLDRTAVRVCEYVEEIFPNIGIEVCTDMHIYFCKDNRVGQMHRNHENLPNISLDYHNILVPWRKAIFLAEEDELPILAEGLKGSPYSQAFQFVQSAPTYYELLPKGISKWSGLEKLAEMLNAKKTIAVGDNHNDVEMIKNADIGIAVANAVEEARDIADLITVDNDSSAIAAIVAMLDMSMLK